MERSVSSSSKDSGVEDSPFIFHSKIIWQTKPGTKGELLARTETVGCTEHLTIEYTSDGNKFKFPMGNTGELKLCSKHQVSSDMPIYTAYRHSDGHLYLERIPGCLEDGQSAKRVMIRKTAESDADYNIIATTDTVAVIEIMPIDHHKHKLPIKPIFWGCVYFFDLAMNLISRLDNIKYPSVKVDDGQLIALVPDDMIVWKTSNTVWILLIGHEIAANIIKIDNKSKSSRIVQTLPEMKNSIEIYGFDDCLYQLSEHRSLNSNTEFTHTLAKYKVKLY